MKFENQGEYVFLYWVRTFDLVGFKVILGSFGAFVSKCPISRKRHVVERNGVKFGNQGH